MLQTDRQNFWHHIQGVWIFSSVKFATSLRASHIGDHYCIPFCPPCGGRWIDCERGRVFWGEGDVGKMFYWSHVWGISKDFFGATIHFLIFLVDGLVRIGASPCAGWNMLFWCFCAKKLKRERKSKKFDGNFSKNGFLN